MNDQSIQRIGKNGYILFLSLIISFSSFAQGFQGYYRFPDVHDNTVVFTAEGDLWTVPLSGGLAQRLTTHAEEEINAAISPDGQTVAFTASYEGPEEIYTMPLAGGLPTRWTYEEDRSVMNEWTPDGQLVYATRAFSKLPEYQLVKVNLQSKDKNVIPLYQATEATFDASGETVYFVRPAYHGNVTKRYKGGTARQIWKYTSGSQEAIKLTTDHLGGSHHPMWFEGRIYFITDRDGTMNIWSMNESGEDLKQHTKHTTFDVRYANLSMGNIVYQRGADIWHYNISSNTTKVIDIRLSSDLEQLREKWDSNPSQLITSANPSPEGDKVVFTARGRVFVFPVKSGRMVSFVDKKDVRLSGATFSHDGENIYALSDETGEFEFVKMSTDGLGASKRITNDGQVLRLEGVVSPDGKWLAYDDLANNMYVLNLATGVSKRISTNNEGILDFSWSPDSQWLAFVQVSTNTMFQIKVHNVKTNVAFDLTTDRANSSSVCWSPDGEFIYFLSDRSFTSLVGSPWGTRQPEPYFDASEKIYHVALKKGTRSPFREPDELYQAEGDKHVDNKKKGKNGEEDQLVVTIDLDGIQQRIQEVPVPAGNYSRLAVNDKALYLMSSETGLNAKRHLLVIKIDNQEAKIKTMVKEASGFDLTAKGGHLLVSKSGSYYMIEAGTGEVSDLSSSKIDLSGWKFPITPKEDWKQIFTDAWRMERDYFYDKNMHGVDWDAMHDKYLPLVDRVTTRTELSDLIGRFVGELSALHTSVRGGDLRTDDRDITVATLGAEFSRDLSQNGYKIDYIYKTDPDYPDERSPLDDPYLDIKVGDVITHVNGTPALSVSDIGQLIRNLQGKQVRLTMIRGAAKKEVIVKPTTDERELRYTDWEYSKRKDVEQKGNDEIGYLHIRAMGGDDLNRFYRDFYPVFNKKGLIIDVRYNYGGNIDSFILEKLLRKAWMYWTSRDGQPASNMPYAFRGHLVVLVNENTYSDGEAFAEGIRELKLGTTIGTRTWGGEIWLHSGNRLSDNGYARAPMFGVYNERGEWVIEGHGFVPDIEIDNLPHATFNGEDAQLNAAIEILQEKIKADPRDLPQPPAYPDKSFGDNKKQ